MLELLIVGLCAGDYACDKATQAYYQDSPRLQAEMRRHEKQARRYVPEVIMYSAPAAVAVATRNKKTVHVYGPVYLSAGHSEALLLYKRSF